MQPESTVLVPLRARDGTIRAHVTIDAADAAMVNQWRWHLNRHGYAARTVYLGGGRANEKKVNVLLHRELLGLLPGDGLEGDHENRTPLDCRRSNLRIATRGENGQNVSAQAGKTSAHRGVHWDERTQRWIAQAKLNGRSRNLGSFSREEDATEAAAAWRAEHMPFSVADKREKREAREMLDDPDPDRDWMRDR